MFEYEISQTRSADLRREADQWRMADVAAKAARELQRSERRVSKRKQRTVRQALRAMRPHNAA
ncbi:hypothetical protein [Streptomyces sp. NBC_01262]|jgi:hypothetical protein|uniref:hypothetical protein n=1 Tax=Streptomyces sp. NBC_01262 TaxID=2903803 RepID=UPI002E3389B0|nr:hypothetical protein [Streptomyces sp. NBC_01262]